MTHNTLLSNFWLECTKAIYTCWSEIWAHQSGDTIRSWIPPTQCHIGTHAQNLLKIIAKHYQHQAYQSQRAFWIEKIKPLIHTYPWFACRRPQLMESIPADMLNNNKNHMHTWKRKHDHMHTVKTEISMWNTYTKEMANIDSIHVLYTAGNQACTGVCYFLFQLTSNFFHLGRVHAWKCD